MSTHGDGGPAFPLPGTNIIEHPEHGRIATNNQCGMSLRDWFAGMALTGIMVKGARAGLKELASDSYDIADAMIAERNKTP